MSNIIPQLVFLTFKSQVLCLRREHSIELNSIYAQQVNYFILNKTLLIIFQTGKIIFTCIFYLLLLLTSKFQHVMQNSTIYLASLFQNSPKKYDIY